MQRAATTKPPRARIYFWHRNMARGGGAVRLCAAAAVCAAAAACSCADVRVACIGGGMAGLAAARTLARAGVGVRVFESSDAPGGRVRSDRVEGFTLDRGFAVFLTAYPESRAAFDYDGLDLHPFCPGAMVQTGPGASNRFLVADPLRLPSATLDTIAFPLASAADKLRLVLAIVSLKLSSLEDIFSRPDVPTRILLEQRWGLSDALIDGFFRPFFGGIFLSPLEGQSSVLFEFVLRMFTDGAAALPAGGLGAAAEQVAAGVRAAGGQIDLGTRAERVRLGDAASGRPHTIVLEGGRQMTCDRLVLSCTSREARRLLGGAGAHGAGGCVDASAAAHAPTDDAPAADRPAQEGAAAKPVGVSLPASAAPSWQSLPEPRPYLESICLYFALSGPPPVSQPFLILNGRPAGRGGQGLINNMCFPSVTCPGYAPPGQHLASVTVVPSLLDQGEREPAWLGEDTALEAAVRRELAEWFSDEVDEWRLLRIYRLKEAQEARPRGPWARSPRLHGAHAGVYACGDYCATPSLNGALESGRLAAEAVLSDLQCSGAPS